MMKTTIYLWLCAQETLLTVLQSLEQTILSERYHEQSNFQLSKQKSEH